MSYLLTLALLVAAGLAILEVLRLRTGRALPDAALAWLVGAGWLAAVATPLRFALGVPFGRPALLAVTLAPVALWGALRARRRRAGAGVGQGEGAPAPPEAAAVAPRWLPGPAWIFAPLALYVVVMAGAVLLHGTNTPTHTDDGVRVRAFAPILAFQDAWPAEARGVFSQAGPLSTFVPAVSWILTGSVDHFHVNYAVLTELVALLLLAIGLGAARGDPERGWAGAFAVLSIPLFVYHCTSTYSDAVLAMRVAGGMALAAEYARTRSRDDLLRACLLLGVSALVKREGELVALAPGGVLLAQLAWERWRERRPVPWRALALASAPVLAAAVGKVAALGLAGAFPMFGFVFTQAAEAAGSAGEAVRPAGMVAQAARVFFVDALFRSGNQGMLYWVLVAVLVARARTLARRELLWPLLGVAALLAEVAISSIVLVPRFTLDQGTVNRAVLVASVPAALWVASAIVDAARAGAMTGAPPARAGGGPVAEGEATPRARRRGSRPASRR